MLFELTADIDKLVRSVPMLEGQKDWFEWNLRMRNTFEMAGYGELLDRDEAIPTDVEWDKVQRRCVACIRSRLSTIIRESVKTTDTTVRKLLNAIESNFSIQVPPIEEFGTAKARNGPISSPKQISPVIQPTKSWYQSPPLDKITQSRIKVQDFAALKDILDNLKKDKEQISRDITILTYILVANGIIPDPGAIEEDPAETESDENPFDI